jgi:cysteine desulfurase family protein
MIKTAYFDNAATTFPKPEKVYTFMDDFYRQYGVNVGRGQHKLAARAAQLVSETRQLLLDLLHCHNKKVVFTHTATEALNIILQGLPLSFGDVVYISPFEHNAVTRVLFHLQETKHINIETLEVDGETLNYDLAKIENQFKLSPPKLVVISHASNVCGVIAPISEICVLSKKYASINVVDMCQTAGLVDVDISSENIDFAVFSGHKTLYGPFGIAGFICSGIIKPEPLIFGGTGVDSANQQLPDNLPERYEVASPNIHAISGLYAALGWIKETSIQKIYDKEQNNHIELLNILRQYNNIKIYAPPLAEQGIGVVSCTFEGYSSDSIGNVLSEKNVAVRSGLHCAPYAHRLLGTFPAGTVRFSVSYFNDESDFYSLKSALDYIEENS